MQTIRRGDVSGEYFAPKRQGNDSRFGKTMQTPAALRKFLRVFVIGDIKRTRQSVWGPKDKYSIILTLPHPSHT
jgi:hypothetical protein